MIRFFKLKFGTQIRMDFIADITGNQRIHLGGGAPVFAQLCIKPRADAAADQVLAVEIVIGGIELRVLGETPDVGGFDIRAQYLAAFQGDVFTGFHACTGKTGVEFTVCHMAVTIVNRGQHRMVPCRR